MVLWCILRRKRVARLDTCWDYEGKPDDQLPWTVCGNCVQAEEETNMLDKGREMPEMEHGNGPQATETSSSFPNHPYYHPSNGFYDLPSSKFYDLPSPDVSAKVEPKETIRIVPLGEGYLVQYGDDLADQKGFTDRAGVAEWLLEWLRFDEDDYCLAAFDLPCYEYDPWCMTEQEQADYYARVHGIGRWADRQEELYNMEYDHDMVLGVVRAADAFVAGSSSVAKYLKLVEAVKKWRGIEGG